MESENNTSVLYRKAMYMPLSYPTLTRLLIKEHVGFRHHFMERVTTAYKIYVINIKIRYMYWLKIKPELFYFIILATLKCKYGLFRVRQTFDSLIHGKFCFISFLLGIIQHIHIFTNQIILKLAHAQNKVFLNTINNSSGTYINHLKLKW